MKKRVRIFLVFLISLVLSCSRSAGVNTGTLKIVTSIFPLCDIAKNIAGGKADVIFVVPPGANPHNFEPVPSVVAKIKEAGLFIGIHRDFDGWIEKFLPEKSRAFYLLEGNDENPHIWLSIRGAKTISRRIETELSRIDSGNRQEYEKNLTQFLARLDEDDKKIAALFHSIKNKKFIQWHPSWNYFADDYHLSISGTIESGHGDEPSVRAFKDLVVLAKKNKTTVIVAGVAQENRAAEALAREMHGSLVKLDSLGNPEIPGWSTYTDMMYSNALLLSGALRSQK